MSGPFPTRGRFKSHGTKRTARSWLFDWRERANKPPLFERQLMIDDLRAGGNPGQGNPAQGNPGQGNPGQGKPGQDNPGQARPGEANPGQRNPG